MAEDRRSHTSVCAIDIWGTELKQCLVYSYSHNAPPMPTRCRRLSSQLHFFLILLVLYPPPHSQSPTHHIVTMSEVSEQQLSKM